MNQYRFDALIGVGGIGTGKFFMLSGNETLGREESRLGHFLDRRDYCKLHIITHYVQRLLGPQFTSLAIGRVGDDEWGPAIIAEMQAAGIAPDFVEIAPGEQTLFGLCFLYPDGSGGNLTVDDSACALVDAAFVSRAAPAFHRFAGRGVALAAPEVPLEARVRLLEMAAEARFFCCASLNAEEARSESSRPLLERTDLLSINLEEAAALAGSQGSPEEITEQAVRVLMQRNPGMLVAVTAGKRGSWVWDGQALTHVPALAIEPVNTAGAGDCFLAGLICGLAANLPICRAQELATLAAGMSVTSPHTIHVGIERRSLAAFTETYAPDAAPEVLAFLRVGE